MGPASSHSHPAPLADGSARSFQTGVLSYFAVRAEEGASSSVYRSLLLSLQFLEEAGEVLKKDKMMLDERNVVGWWLLPL